MAAVRVRGNICACSRNEGRRDDSLDHAVDIEIRQAIPADITALMELASACIANLQAQGIDQWDDVYPDRGIIQGDIDDGTAFIATIAGAISGMATLNERQDPEYAEVPWRIPG